MEGADKLVAIVEAFVNAVKRIFDALKAMFGMAEETTTAAAE